MGYINVEIKRPELEKKTLNKLRGAPTCSLTWTAHVGLDLGGEKCVWEMLGGWGMQSCGLGMSWGESTILNGGNLIPCGILQ